MSEFQYSKVSECIWMDDGFQGLSLEGRYVWFYLLTNPAKKSMGVYRMPVAGMAAEAGMEEGVFRAALGEVVAAGMVSVDERKHVVVIWKYLVHNRPANGNIVRSWKGVVKGLPECDLVGEYLQWVTGYMAELGDGFVKAFVECLGNRLGNGLGNGIGNGTPTLLTLNSYLKTPLTPLAGGDAAGEEEKGGEGKEDSRRGAEAQREGGAGEASGSLQGRGIAKRELGNEGDGTEGTDGTAGGVCQGHAEAQGGSGEAGRLECGAGAGEILAVEGSGRRRGRRKGLGAGDDPLAGLSVLSEAYGVFRERLVAVHGAKATLAAAGVERGVLARLVREGFEERDVVAVLKWVLWEEPGPRVPGGFCWRDQFRSFGGLVKPTRNGEMKFKAMAAAYEAWARQVGGVAARGRGTGGHGQGAGVRGPGREEIGVEDGPRLRFVVV